MFPMSGAIVQHLDFDEVGCEDSFAFEVLERVGRLAGRANVKALSDDDLLTSVGAVERSRRQTDAAEAHLLAELDSRGLTNEHRGLRTGQWIALETHESIPAAQRRVGIALRI